ncbi:hypothetical protein L195_g062035, partial [Trifolium pratense]
SSGEQSQCSKGPWRETASLSEQTSKEVRSAKLSEIQRTKAKSYGLVARGSELQRRNDELGCLLRVRKPLLEATCSLSEHHFAQRTHLF